MSMPYLLNFIFKIHIFQKISGELRFILFCYALSLVTVMWQT